MHGKTKDSEQYTNQFADPKEFAAHACAFTGHRPNKFPWRYNEDSPGCAALKKTLAEQIAALADDGYTNFLSGMTLGVDGWCSQIVLDLREKNPALKLYCILPCEGQDAKWPAASRERYHAILKRADSIVRDSVAAALAVGAPKLSLPAIESQLRAVQERQMELMRLAYDAGSENTAFDAELRGIYEAKAQLMMLKAEAEHTEQDITGYDERMGLVSGAIEMDSGAIEEYDDIMVR